MQSVTFKFHLNLSSAAKVLEGAAPVNTKVGYAFDRDARGASAFVRNRGKGMFDSGGRAVFNVRSQGAKANMFRAHIDLRLCMDVVCGHELSTTPVGFAYDACNNGHAIFVATDFDTGHPRQDRHGLYILNVKANKAQRDIQPVENLQPLEEALPRVSAPVPEYDVPNTAEVEMEEIPF